MKQHTFKGFSFLGIGILFLFQAFTATSFAQTSNVRSIRELTNAINNANSGSTIIVKNGTYTTSEDITIRNKKGTSSKPITIKAETIGGVIIKGAGGFRIDKNSEYITIEGFVFKHKATRGAGHQGKHCLITRNVYECTDPGNTNNSSASYLKISGPNNEISYNTFQNKDFRGPILSVQGPNRKVAKNNWIHHNYFTDFPDRGTNDNAAIQPGYRALIESKAFLLIEHNLFNNLKADAEGTISVKCWNVTFRYNTVTDCNETVLRQGNESKVYGNYFFKGSGVRFSDADHQVYNNVFVNTKTGVRILRKTQADKDGGYSHFPPNNGFVGFNTMIGCDKGILHSGSGESKNVKMVNNIFYNCKTAIDKSGTNWTNPLLKGNITWNSPKGALPTSGFTNQNPLFTIDSNGVPHLRPNSPVIGRAQGNYNFVKDDIDKENRSGNMDIGADQYKNAVTKNPPLTTSDVGPNANSKNLSPKVRFVNPEGNITVNKGYSLSVRVEADDPDGMITEVTLYINNNQIRSEVSPPYDWGHAQSPNPNELNDLPSGDYIVKAIATDNRGASVETTFTLRVIEPTLDTNSLELASKNKIKIYPIPVNNQFTISELPGNASLIQVYDIYGKTLLTQRIDIKDTEHQIDISTLDQGVYFVLVVAKKQTKTIQILKK